MSTSAKEQSDDIGSSNLLTEARRLLETTK